MKKFQCSSALPNIKYNCVVLFLSQLYILFIYVSKYFLIDHHCKWYVRIFWSPHKRQNLLMFLQSVLGDVSTQSAQIYSNTPTEQVTIERDDNTIYRNIRRISLLRGFSKVLGWSFTMDIYVKLYLGGYINNQHIWLKNNTTELYSILGRADLHSFFPSVPKHGSDKKEKFQCSSVFPSLI